MGRGRGQGGRPFQGDLGGSRRGWGFLRGSGSGDPGVGQGRVRSLGGGLSKGDLGGVGGSRRGSESRSQGVQEGLSVWHLHIQSKLNS